MDALKPIAIIIALLLAVPVSAAATKAGSTVTLAVSCPNEACIFGETATFTASGFAAKGADAGPITAYIDGALTATFPASSSVTFARTFTVEGTHTARVEQRNRKGALVSEASLSFSAVTGTCSVSPNPAYTDPDPNHSPIATFTVYGSATSGHWIAHLREPGQTFVSGWGPFASPGSFDWSTPYTGQGTVEVFDVNRQDTPVAACTFTVIAG